MMNGTPHDRPPGPRNIADPFLDLLLPLDEGRRLGFIQRLAVGYYEQWRPTREEVAFLVDIELGRSVAELAPPPVGSSADSVVARAAHDEQTRRRPSNPVVGARPIVQPLRPPLTRAPGSGSGAVKSNSTPLATFSVDCGLLAPPLRFIAYGLSSAGFIVRSGERYRRMFLHYRLMNPVRPVAGRPTFAETRTFTADIACIPDVPAPASADDGRMRKHSARSGVVTGSRGPWPVADGVTAISFLITAQAAAGTRQRRHPAGVLHVDLRSGAASWRAAGGHEAGDAGHAVAQ